MNPLELARQRLQNSRDRTAMKIADRNYSPSDLSGSYAGYDCRTGEQVTQFAGNTIRSKSVSNGANQQGEIIAINLPQGGIAQSSQMPS